MKTLILLLSSLVFAPTFASAASSFRTDACLPAAQRLAIDGNATKLAKTATALRDRYADIESGSEVKCIHFVEARGPGENRPLLVLLHGVPETWYAWRKVIDPLVDAGFDLIIPDLPGMGQSSRPASVDSLALPVLAHDIRQLIELNARNSAVVVGHDIGGTVAWAVGMYEPATVQKLVILSAPHPGTWRKALVDQRVPEQFEKSRYAYDFAYHGEFFAWVTDNLPKQLNLSIQAFHNPVNLRKFTPNINGADLRIYAAELGRAQQPLWITRYYTQIFVNTLKIREADIQWKSELWPLKPLRRAWEAEHKIVPVDAGLPTFTAAPEFPAVNVPTLLIFDQDDPYNSDVYLSEDELNQTAPNHKVVRLEAKDSTHWIAEDAPAQVVEALKKFIRSE